MVSEAEILKVTPLVEEFLQATSAEGEYGLSLWSAVRYNNTNAWYVNSNNGNINNNNTYNRYAVVPCPSVDLLFPMLLEAEESCYKNKHHSLTAARIHYHLSELFKFCIDICKNGIRVGPSKCFVLSYPVYREIFCAEYFDRIIHHMIAPLMLRVAEEEHLKSGDISHGNRFGHSAYTAAVSVQESLREVTDNWKNTGWVATQDYSGFFMSINRELASNMFRSLSEKYNMPFLTDIVCLYLNSDPTKDCRRMSPLSLWKFVKDNKSLFRNKPGHGLPIGNFPSQIEANLFRSNVDKIINELDNVKQVVFVDDRMLCSSDKSKLTNALKTSEIESNKIGLKINQKKKYFQKIDKGLKFCGYVIKCDRIYISNRVVSACFKTIREYDDINDAKNELALLKSINSCLFLFVIVK